MNGIPRPPSELRVPSSPESQQEPQRWSVTPLLRGTNPTAPSGDRVLTPPWRASLKGLSLPLTCPVSQARQLTLFLARMSPGPYVNDF